MEAKDLEAKDANGSFILSLNYYAGSNNVQILTSVFVVIWMRALVIEIPSSFEWEHPQMGTCVIESPL